MAVHAGAWSRTGSACGAAGARLFGTMTTSESCRGHFLGRSIAASGRPITSTDQRGAFLNTIGHNVRIDYRWGTTYLDRGRRYAEELVALAPDVILSAASASTAAAIEATRTVPIVFVGVVDPVGAGYVNSLARPGGNATGFLFYEYSLGANSISLLIFG